MNKKPYNEESKSPSDQAEIDNLSEKPSGKKALIPSPITVAIIVVLIGLVIALYIAYKDQYKDNIATIIEPIIQELVDKSIIPKIDTMVNNVDGVCKIAITKIGEIEKVPASLNAVSSKEITDIKETIADFLNKQGNIPDNITEAKEAIEESINDRSLTTHNIIKEKHEEMSSKIDGFVELLSKDIRFKEIYISILPCSGLAPGIDLQNKPIIDQYLLCFDDISKVQPFYICSQTNEELSVCAEEIGRKKATMNALKEENLPGLYRLDVRPFIAQLDRENNTTTIKISGTSERIDKELAVIKSNEILVKMSLEEPVVPVKKKSFLGLWK